jgi:putative restriction endonuclease
MQKIRIEKKIFEIVDAREYMTIPDCFVLKNKTGIGHGEAKFYVGNENRETNIFFDDYSRKCIFLKKDLEKYIKEAEAEYKNPEQNYKNKSSLSGDWFKYKREIESISDEIIEFHIFRSEVTPPRVYINSRDKIYSLLRKISLPQISYLSALKIKSSEDGIIYYFRPFIDYYYFGGDEHPSVMKKEQARLKEDNKIDERQKDQIVRARIGQGKYREKLIEEFPCCMMTGVSDERLLIASHIKPWAESDNVEKIDPKNGFMLTPTYDRLFDRGFISFTDDGLLLISPWISPMNQKRLSLSPRKKYSFQIDGRKNYLRHHREKIFKGND